MRIHLAALVAASMLTAPALAGDLELYQVGQSNWVAANQYNRTNSVKLLQEGINANGNNYGAFIQQGRRNSVNSEQYSLTDNSLAIEQAGRNNYVGAYQEALGFNKFSLTQTRLNRR